MGLHENNLYYLFPGQGQGKRKRFVMHLTVGFIVGAIVAGLMAGAIYAMQS